MEEATDREETMPEPTEEEIAWAVIQTKKDDAQFAKLFRKAPESARMRLAVTAAMKMYQDVRNLWPLRERRDLLEATMPLDGIEYLAQNHYLPEAREYFGELLMNRKTEASLTPVVFGGVIANAPKQYQAVYFITLSKLYESKAPHSHSTEDIARRFLRIGNSKRKTRRRLSLWTRA